MAFGAAEMLQALQRLVLSESPSLDKSLCDSCAEEVASLFQTLTGATVERHRHASAGDSLEMRLGSGEGGVLVLLHHDTVWDAGTIERLPFQVDGDRVTGPGSYDMKAGIVEAAFALREARPRLRRPVTILSTPDEEVGSWSSRDLIEKRATASAAVLVLEPAARGGAIKTARKGVADFTIRVRGRAAHAGVEPEKGVSATVELAHQVLKVVSLADLQVGTTVNVGRIGGGTRPNVVPAEAWAMVDVRIPSSAESERITAEFGSLRPHLQGATVTIEGGVNRPAMERHEGVARLAQFAQSVAAELGFELKEASTGGGSDGNFTAALGIPTLDGLGPAGGGAHAESEHFFISSWLQRTELLQVMLEKL